MAVKLRVLILEDSESDTELTLHELRGAGYDPEWCRVETEPHFLGRLVEGWEIILSDYNMPEFSAPRALELLRERDLDIPFLIVSGTIGEDKAVATMKAGANDYIMKDRMNRLGPAVERELREAVGRRERRRAEAGLLRTNTLLNSIVENIPDMIFLKAARDLRFVRFNRAGEDLLGHPRQAILGKNDHDLFPREQAGFFAEKDREVLLSKKVLDIPEEHIQTRHKGERILHTKKVPILDAEGRPEYLLGISEDITEQKRAEGALRDSEERYRGMFENSLVGISQALPDGRLIFANNAYARMYGFADVRELLAEVPNVGRFYADPEDRQEVLRILVEKGIMNSTEMVVVRRDGVRFTVLVGAREIRDSQGNLLYYQAEHIDITDRKRAEQALKESESQYRLLADNANDVIFVMDMEMKYSYVSPSVKTLRGVEPEEMLHQPALLTLTPASAELAKKNLAEVLTLEKAGGQETPLSRTLQLEMKRKDGTTVWTEVKFSFIRDGRGRIEGILGVTRDITERRGEFERIRKALGETVQAISYIVETRDPYTAGHQRRVADLARAMAVEMGLPPDRIEGLRMAASIHDIGKISVPAEILSKPTKLTEIEFLLIKSHSQSGYDILKDIAFPWPIARMVLEHHERTNGSGYPNGLTGDRLLLESQILSVADVVEAMASNRPYRPSLGIDAALAEISKNQGIYYAPDAAITCLRLFRDQGYQIIN